MLRRSPVFLRALATALCLAASDSHLAAQPCPGARALAATLATPQGLDALLECFRQPGFETAEAVAIFGAVSRVDRRSSGFDDLVLWARPSLPGVREITLETRSGELIGLMVDLETPVLLDVEALGRRFPPLGRAPAPIDSFDPELHRISIEDPSFKSYALYSAEDWDAPLTARPILRVLMRRFAQFRDVPRSWNTADDLARLVPLLLYRLAPTPIELAGHLGVWGPQSPERARFRQLDTAGNLAEAYVEKGPARAGEQDATASGVFLRFHRPVEVEVPTFAAAVDGKVVPGEVGTISLEIEHHGVLGSAVLVSKGEPAPAVQVTSLLLRRSSPPAPPIEPELSLHSWPCDGWCFVLLPRREPRPTEAEILAHPEPLRGLESVLRALALVPSATAFQWHVPFFETRQAYPPKPDVARLRRACLDRGLHFYGPEGPLEEAEGYAAPSRRVGWGERLYYLDHKLVALPELELRYLERGALGERPPHAIYDEFEVSWSGGSMKVRTDPNFGAWTPTRIEVGGRRYVLEVGTSEVLGAKSSYGDLWAWPAEEHQKRLEALYGKAAEE